MVGMRDRRDNLYCRPWCVAVVVAAIAVGPGRAAPASEHGESSEPHAKKATELKEDATKSGSNGMELGEFRIRAYYPAESQKSTASFSLYATAAKDKLSESEHLLENRLHKLRDQVIVVTRMFPLSDFNDPELKGFRRRILLQLRRTLPELSIEDVFVSDFALTVERI
jgi:hypothetical protein